MGKGKDNRTSRRQLSLVLTLRPLQENTHQRSACTPNMKGEQTPGPTMTEGSFMKVAGMSSVLNFWKRPGRKRWMIGPNALNLNCQNGLEKDQAKRLESLSLRMMKMKDQQKLPLVLKRKKKKRRRKKRKKSKYHSSS